MNIQILLDKGLNEEDAAIILKNIKSKNSIYGLPGYSDLFQYYCNSGLMPYGIAKARTGDPDVWISEALEQEWSEWIAQDIHTCYVDTDITDPNYPIEDQYIKLCLSGLSYTSIKLVFVRFEDGHGEDGNWVDDSGWSFTLEANEKGLKYLHKNKELFDLCLRLSQNSRPISLAYKWHDMAKSVIKNIRCN